LSPTLESDALSAVEWAERNTALVLHKIIDTIPHRTETEALVLHTAVDNLGTDLEKLLANQEVVSPSQGQPNAVVQALEAQVAETNAKVDRLIAALEGNATVNQAVTEGTPTPTEVPADSPPA
jgi:hypothetical protein